MKILHVEDDEIQRVVWCHILHDKGFDVIGTSGMESAIGALNENPDIAIVDYGAVDDKGAIAHRIHELKPELPLIIISGLPVPDETLRSLDAAASFTKPIDIEKLINEIKKSPEKAA